MLVTWQKAPRKARRQGPFVRGLDDLDVVSQEVVDIGVGPGAADGRHLIEASMRSMPVVLVYPRGEMVESIFGVWVEPDVGPFADGGLDEALRLAVGAGSVDAGADMFDIEFPAGEGEAMGIEARAVIGHDAPHLDAEPGEVSHSLVQETCRGSGFFIRHHGGEGDAGVVVDGHIEELPAGAAGFVLGIAGDAMAGFDDAGQLLDVDVQQVSRGGVFVAHDGDLGLQHFGLVELQPSQDAAHRGPAEPGGLRDPHSGPALPPKPFHALDQLRTHAAWRAMRTRGSVHERRPATLAETAHPLGSTLPAEPALGGRLAQAQPAFYNAFCKLLSTVNCQSSMMVIVHSVS